MLFGRPEVELMNTWVKPAASGIQVILNYLRSRWIKNPATPRHNQPPCCCLPANIAIYSRLGFVLKGGENVGRRKKLGNSHVAVWCYIFRWCESKARLPWGI